MFIKVEVGENAPVYYKFTQSELSIGSSPSNSIVINHKSVSKKHAKLVQEGDKWFAMDQGSTNGSYLEDDQLIPGKRVEIGVDVPLRLGDHTIVQFVAEAENPIDVHQTETSSVASSINSESDRTRVINLADLQAAKVAADKKRKLEQQQKKAKELKKKKEEQAKLFKIAIACVVVVILGVIGNKWWQEKMKRNNKDTIVRKLQNKYADDMEIDSDLEGFKIPRRHLLSEKVLAGYLNGQLCHQVDVTDLCRIENVYGVKFIKPSSFLFFLDESKFRVDAKILFPEEMKMKEDDIRKAIGLMFLTNNFTGSSFSSGSVLYVVMFEAETKQITGVLAVKSSSFQSILSEGNTEEKMVKNFTKLQNYYRYYPETTQPHIQSRGSEERSASPEETEDP